MTLAEYPDVGRVEHVAAALDCSKWSVYQLIESGELKAVRVGRAIRVTRGALEASSGLTSSGVAAPPGRAS